MNWWDRAIGRDTDVDVLTEIVRFMYGSRITVAIAGFSYGACAFLAYIKTDDTFVAVLMLAGVALGLVRVAIIEYGVRLAPARMTRTALEHMQIRYALAGIAFSLMAGLLVGSAALTADYMAFGVTAIFLAAYVSGLLIYVSVRPVLGLIQSIVPPIVAMPMLLAANDVYLNMMAVLFTLLVVNSIKVNGQQSKILLEVFQGRHRERIRARTDRLTGIGNRFALDEAMEAIPDGQRVAVIFLDLDGFKFANDSFGHDTGDDILQQVGWRIQLSLRRRDIVARRGGDEFVVLLRGERSLDAAAIAARIRESVAGRYDAGGHTADIDASVGVAAGTVGLKAIAEIMRQADGAMYVAKQSGKGRVSVAGERADRAA